MFGHFRLVKNCKLNTETLLPYKHYEVNLQKQVFISMRLSFCLCPPAERPILTSATPEGNISLLS